MLLSKTGILKKSTENIYSAYIAKDFFFKSNKMYNTKTINLVQSCIPPLDGKSHKGQAGRIGIVGGSLEYTGAPFFAGISALKVGADLVHIFCTKAAAGVIKSYSPELIVHPLLDTPNAVSDISPWLERLHAIVIGPGLGRETGTFSVVSELIQIISKRRIPLVIDADGLILINNNPKLLNSFSSPVILTPNKIEFERLCGTTNVSERLEELGTHVTILRKGTTDELYSNNLDVQWKSNIGGSGRRCGGQGDILSGSIATFLHWTLGNIDKIDTDTKMDNALLAASISCYAASLLVRQCNERAFKNRGRSMLATDMIEYIHDVFEDLFGK